MVIPLFQNCGLAPTNSGAGLDSSTSTTTNPDCLSAVVDCGPLEEYLEITLDVQNPTVLALGTSSLIAYGRCNTGNYPSHTIRYIITDPNANELATVDSPAACVKGFYQLTVNLTSLSDNVQYGLNVSIIGIDENGDSHQNTNASGSASIDFSRQ